MSKIAIATVAAALALLASPVSAGQYGHGHGYGHSHHHHSSHHHSYHRPSYHSHHAYQQPHYVKPYVHVAPTTTYEKRQAYVYQKVPGYCTDVVKSYGYNQHRKTVECKAGEYQKPEAKIAHVEPAPVPMPVEEVPQK